MAICKRIQTTIRELQIKITIRYHPTLVRLLFTKKPTKDNKRWWEECVEIETLALYW